LLQIDRKKVEGKKLLRWRNDDLGSFLIKLQLFTMRELLGSGDVRGVEVMWRRVKEFELENDELLLGIAGIEASLDEFLVNLWLNIHNQLQSKKIEPPNFTFNKSFFPLCQLLAYNEPPPISTNSLIKQNSIQFSTLHPNPSTA
jgi:hypothetical protein